MPMPSHHADHAITRAGRTSLGGTDLLRRPICKRAQPHNEEAIIINRNLLCIPLATCRLYARATRAQEEAIHLFAEIINKP